METTSKNKNYGSYVFVGCMFIGAAIGMMAGKTEIGGALGMGIGFLIWGLMKFNTNDGLWKKEK